MQLRWEGHWGSDEKGFLAVTIVYYDVPRGWAVSITQERLDGGPWPTEEAAKAAAQAAVAEMPPGPHIKD